MDIIEQHKDKKKADSIFSLTNIPYSSWITIDDKGKYKIIVTELSQFLKDNLNYIFVKNGPGETPFMYVYMNGYYRYVTEDEFKGAIKQFIPYQLVKMKEINEIYQDIKTSLRSVSHEELNTDENIINFQDGLLYLDTMELKPHTPEILSTIQIPANYKDVESSPALSPVFDKYMEHLLDGDVVKYELIMQYLGLAISNVYGYRTKKALFLVGEGNTGKSQIKKMAEQLLGTSNICNIDLEKLNEKFGTGSIYQKRLSGCNDMSFQRVADMSIFKSITGGDEILFEFKFKSSFTSLHKGVLWFNCNKMPLFGGDKGDWVYERIIPIYCGKPVPEEDRDAHLFEKMWKEKDTIIRVAISYLKKLIKNNYKFTLPEDSKKYLERYKIENNTLLSFIEECCLTGENLSTVRRTRKNDFKKAYYKWCDINNNGKGKLKLRDIEETIEKKYKEDYGIADGYKVLNKIKLSREAEKDLGLYLDY